MLTENMKKYQQKGFGFRRFKEQEMSKKEKKKEFASMSGLKIATFCEV